MIGRLAESGKAILISSHILTELAEICNRVAIIEQGRLLAVGSVEEISGRAQARAEVRLRVLRDAELVKNWLAARGDVAELTCQGDSITFTHAGDAESEAALLRAIVEAGFAVVEFGAHRKSLEDVFLHVTEGRVQ